MKSILRNCVEPGAIILFFTISTLTTRRSPSKKPDHDSSDVESMLIEATEDMKEAKAKTRTSLENTDGETGSARYDSTYAQYRRKNLQSRLMWRFPFLMEIWYWLLTYWIYQGLRAYSARKIVKNEAVFDKAYRHAQQVLFVEQMLHIDIELAFQRFVFERIPSLMFFLARIYFSHIALGVAFIGYSYRYLPRWRFASIRRTIALENVIAFFIFSAWRCMPPRLLPEEVYGFVDILHQSRVHTAWTDNSNRLTIAAMPSLHFANSLFIGWSLSKFSPHRILRVIAPFWPVAMGVSIIGTANHYILDLVAGTMVLLTAYRFNRLIISLMPIERFIFGLLRLERPDENRQFAPLW